MEHNYQYINGWFDFEDVYSHVVSIANDNALFVELGTYKGKSASYMLTEIINSGKNIEFHTVDNFGGDDVTKVDPDQTREEIRNNLSRFEGKYKFIEKDALELADDYENESIDFLFIDDCHSYIHVRDELIKWLPKLKKQGIIAGHDYSTDENSAWAGVGMAVRERFTSFEVWQNCWLVRLNKKV